ncbi:MAG TPA: AAA family ATPase [Herpetosiphonaceae bacterium]|nr:AAA family ATPase [Herpetosiphonaceae bacterium]
MPNGRIILLNGTSSAGKTTLARALQGLFDEPYLRAGVDHFVFMLPGRYLNQPHWNEVYRYTWSAGGSIATIEPGPVGHRLMSAMHQTATACARAGLNVIMDHVLLDRRWLQECVELWDGLAVLFVGVRCPLEVVEQRERDRKARTLGQARAQWDQVHAHGVYDIQVDTSQLDPDAAAQVIKRGLDDLPTPTAFERLRQRPHGNQRSK